jgi:hypothetical protein
MYTFSTKVIHWQGHFPICPELLRYIRLVRLLFRTSLPPTSYDVEKAHMNATCVKLHATNYKGLFSCRRNNTLGRLCNFSLKCQKVITIRTYSNTPSIITLLIWGAWLHRSNFYWKLMRSFGTHCLVLKFTQPDRTQISSFGFRKKILWSTFNRRWWFKGQNFPWVPRNHFTNVGLHMTKPCCLSSSVSLTPRKLYWDVMTFPLCNSNIL